MKPARELTGPQLTGRIVTLSNRALEINNEFIDTGRGRERPSEIRTQGDPLSLAWLECATELAAAHDERARRLAYHGTMRPIPRSE